MKILIVANTFWPDYAGWANQTLGLIRSCDNKDCVFTVVTRKDPTRNKKHPFIKDIKFVEFSPPIASRSKLAKLQFFIPAFSYLIKHKELYDLIFLPIAYLPFPFIIPLARKLKKPVVTRLAANEMVGTNVFSRIRRKLLMTSDVIVCLNKETMEIINRQKKNKAAVRYIPNGIVYSKLDVNSKKLRNSLRKKLGFPRDAKIVCFAGLINKRKGVDILIKGFQKIQKNDPDTHLLLIGPYERAAEIDPLFIRECKDFIQSADMGDRIHFTGRVDNLDEYFLGSDIFVLPSLSEGMPNVLLEAMAAGLPSVCSDIPGVRELITPKKNGILVQPGDAVGFSDAISILLHDPDMRLQFGRESIRRIEKYHTMEKVSRLYQELFTELIK